jgi:hypothetical protein
VHFYSSVLYLYLLFFCGYLSVIYSSRSYISICYMMSHHHWLGNIKNPVKVLVNASKKQKIQYATVLKFLFSVLLGLIYLFCGKRSNFADKVMCHISISACQRVFNYKMVPRAARKDNQIRKRLPQLQQGHLPRAHVERTTTSVSKQKWTC